ncbi:MAG: formylmethanofuran dehydrogenase subunit E family protein [Thermoplasmatales archaeon]|nr:MAG: formylmethanofuran dehydrogenase subunit E family protein [Thermoplasmatales archaeon]
MNKILDDIKKFHGHIGPYVIIGYKIGIIANKLLDSDHFSKKVKVWTKKFPPMSCVIDGIQLSSGCTIGKGSIIVKNGEFLKTEFSNNEGKKIQISLKMQIKEDIEQNVKKDNMESYSKKILQMLDSDLFNIKES